MSYNFHASLVAPVSPVPSNQASSQSGETTPYGNSVRSEHTINTSSFSPLWATPSSPSNPFIYGDTASPTSRFGNGNVVVFSFDKGDDEYSNDASQYVDIDTCDTQKHTTTLEAKSGADLLHMTRPTRDEVNYTDGVHEFKNKQHSKREHGANTKALMLLQETAGYDVTCTAVPVDKQVLDYERLNDNVCPDSQQTIPTERNRTFLSSSKIVGSANSETHQRETWSTNCSEENKQNMGRAAARLTRDEPAEGVHTYKSNKHSKRECSASTKALMLLQETAGYDVKCTAVPMDRKTTDFEPPFTKDTHSAVQKRTQNEEVNIVDGTISKRGANMRIVAPLEATAGREASVLVKAVRVSQEKPALTVRQAAQQSYQLRKKSNAADRGKTTAANEIESILIPRLVVKVEKEALAESTRAPRVKTGDDLRDPNTVEGMKCSGDIERENLAKKKALQLLNERPGCLA
jgi:hypothetical protein